MASILSLTTGVVYARSISGTLTFTSGSLQLADGTAGAPSLTFASETTTGWYRSGVGQISAASGNAVLVKNGTTNKIIIDPNLIAGSGVGLAGDYTVFWSSTTSASGTPDLLLARDAANTLAQKNGTNAQTFNLYFSTTGTKLTKFKAIDDGVLALQNGAATGFTRLILGTNDNTVTGASLVLNGSGNIDIASGDGTANRSLRAVSFTTFSGGTYSSTDTTGTVVTNGTQSVASAGIISIGTSTTIGYLVVTSAEDNEAGLFEMRGGGTPTIVQNGGSIFSNTLNNASTINVYWDGVSAYKLQNNRVASRTIRIVKLGAN